jgi:hypothetical protein
MLIKAFLLLTKDSARRMKNKMTKIMISNVITLILVIQKFLILRYERERIKIEKLLTLGYTTSGDP